ncbi:hypothetical protein GETHLI_34230 [Geothrix limicola]|uniref:DUF1569 domain-containing protein n=1 Tax=Geothrix limicola TaxID=2927978 RepID=A0ABQ5QKY5_9BACT|nr:DUF1569 domain-containing protein [Geothrix limicola]GLH74921.1 hypothetical protein GETHLI_34230 [Geothrix limicola]
MKNLFEAPAVESLKTRLASLAPEQPRLWGRMNAAQALAHCSAGLEMAMGFRRPPRDLLGRIIGRIIKRLALGNEEPMRRNTPTQQDLVVTGTPDFEAERARLRGLIDTFSTGGPEVCSTHPHTFFGPLTPQEWSVLMYKHLDHHLRQFGA